MGDSLWTEATLTVLARRRNAYRIGKPFERCKRAAHALVFLAPDPAVKDYGHARFTSYLEKVHRSPQFVASHHIKQSIVSVYSGALNDVSAPSGGFSRFTIADNVETWIKGDS